MFLVQNERVNTRCLGDTTGTCDGSADSGSVDSASNHPKVVFAVRGGRASAARIRHFVFTLQALFSTWPQITGSQAPRTRGVHGYRVSKPRVMKPAPWENWETKETRQERRSAYVAKAVAQAMADFDEARQSSSRMPQTVFPVRGSFCVVSRMEPRVGAVSDGFTIALFHRPCRSAKRSTWLKSAQSCWLPWGRRSCAPARAFWLASYRRWRTCGAQLGSRHHYHLANLL